MSTRKELETGLSETGLMNGRRFSEHIGVAHGTVKRWLHEGMPAERIGHKVWIDPGLATEWIDLRFEGRKTISFSRFGLVYFAKTESGLTKIGWSSDVMRRVAEMRKKRKESVELVACFPGDKPVELAIHNRFAHLREYDEFYKDDGSIESYLKSLSERLVA